MIPFEPTYRILPPLLDSIKRITLLVHDLNQQVVPDVVWARLQKEARAVSTYASTSIEGNPLPLTEVRRLLKANPEHIRQSEREVLNYNSVLEMLSERREEPFTAVLIQQIQASIMAGLLPDHQLGQWRREPVVIYAPSTQDIIYLPPNHEDVPALMTGLVAFVQQNRGILDPILLAGLVHRQMVIIHPFIDGNGRTTRLATKLLLAGLGLNTFSLFSFENFYNQNVTRYFQQVGLFGDYYELRPMIDFTSWLVYFAEGILDELWRVEKELTRAQASPTMTLQPHHEAILAHIAARGFIMDKDYAQLTERAKATRMLDFRKLLDLGLIVRHGRGRQTHYRLPEN